MTRNKHFNFDLKDNNPGVFAIKVSSWSKSNFRQKFSLFGRRYRTDFNFLNRRDADSIQYNDSTKKKESRNEKLPQTINIYQSYCLRVCCIIKQVHHKGGKLS